jgi:hypothetical protein
VPGASIVGHGVAWQEYGAMRCAYCALRAGKLCTPVFGVNDVGLPASAQPTRAVSSKAE